VIADHLLRLIAKAHCFVGVEVDIEFVERILQTAQSQTYRAVAHVGALGVLGWVVVNINDIVEHAHSNGHHACDHVAVKFPVYDKCGEVE
jgi:hypothetical protein